MSTLELTLYGGARRKHVVMIAFLNHILCFSPASKFWLVGGQLMNKNWHFRMFVVQIGRKNSNVNIIKGQVTNQFILLCTKHLVFCQCSVMGIICLHFPFNLWVISFYSTANIILCPTDDLEECVHVLYMYIFFMELCKSTINYSVF